MESYAWPLAVAVITIMGMWIFKDPLSALIRRIRSAGTSGVTIDSESSGRQEELTKSMVGKEELLQEFENSLLLHEE